MLSDKSDPGLPWISTDQMREVDRLMMEEYGVLLIQMAENAGRNLAHLARQRFLKGDPRGSRILVLAGPGGNGAGGLVCARRLHNWGATALVWLSRPASQLADFTRHQLDILKHMGVSTRESPVETVLPKADLIIDALIGYSLKGAPGGIAAQLILASQEHAAPILSLDVPTGVDAATGTAYEPGIRADATLTLALPKEGLRAAESRDRVGELYLGDISVPPELYARPSLGLEVGAVFAQNEIVQLW